MIEIPVKSFPNFWYKFTIFWQNINKIYQRMARANLNKSEWLLTNTTAASKYTHMKPRICIN